MYLIKMIEDNNTLRVLFSMILKIPRLHHEEGPCRGEFSQLISRDRRGPNYRLLIIGAFHGRHAPKHCKSGSINTEKN